MYEAFFKFQSRPFPAAPVVANYFPSQSIEAARQNLVRAVERAEGPGIIVGPAGVGKTLLLRVLSEHFSHALRVVLLSGTRVTTRKSLLQSILFELNMPYRSMDEGELRLAMIDALRRDESIPAGILLLVDEAHTLPLRLLDEVRLITNIVHDGQSRVRLILAGNPLLEERFTNPKLDSFNQRIAARCYLQTFSREETHEYVRAEVSWAGGDPDSIFTPQAVQAIFQATDGIPRLINQVCDHALLMSFGAGERRIGGDRIQEAWADLQQLPPPWHPTPSGVLPIGNAVIEFGQLDEEDGDLADPSTLESNFASHTNDPCVAQNDCPSEGSREAAPVDMSSFMTDTVVVSPPYLDGNLEWLQCGEQADNLEPVRRLDPNPFEEAFEEDLIVIDRVAARSLDGFRGRPRVSSVEGREFAAALSKVLFPSETQAQARQELVDSGTQSAASLEAGNISCLAANSALEPAFEFSTLQDFPVIDSPNELFDDLETITSGHEEQVDLDFEDEVDCVPLPWTRGLLEDDRDIIVVHEDTPQPPFDGTAPELIGQPRRAEYRELFAQLRRALT